MDIGAFRAAFPEFASVTRYPDSLITSWGVIATRFVNPNRWKTSTTLGIQLYVAHEITLQAQSIQAAQNGGIPGSQGGIANSKTVGSVTVAYDATSTAEKDAGWWNLTIYGKQYYRLVKMFGSGCIQL